MRNALLLTAAGDDPGPAGKLFLATRMLTRRSGTITTPFVQELAALWAAVAEHVELGNTGGASSVARGLLDGLLDAGLR